MRAALLVLALLAAGAAGGSGPYSHRGTLPAGTWVAGTSHLYFVTLEEGAALEVELEWDRSQGAMQAYVADEAASCAPDDAACLAGLALDAALLCGAAETPFPAPSPARLRFVAPRAGTYALRVAPVALAGLADYEVTLALPDGRAPVVAYHTQGFSALHASPACGLA